MPFPRMGIRSARGRLLIAFLVLALGCIIAFGDLIHFGAKGIWQDIVGYWKKPTKSASADADRRELAEDDYVQAVRKLIETHPALQSEAWVHLPELAKATSRAEITKLKVKELELNGADVTLDAEGEITVVDLSHLKPDKPKKDVDEGMPLLEGLPRLKMVVLYNTRVSADGLRHLCKCNSLEELELGWTMVGDEGVAHLNRLTGLKGLGLFNVGITDIGMVHLKDMKHLKRLVMSDNAVTDAGMAHLGAMSELEDLRLDNTKVTWAEVQKIQRRLPKCEIIAKERPTNDEE